MQKLQRLEPGQSVNEMRMRLITRYVVRPRSVCRAIVALVAVCIPQYGAWAMGKVSEEDRLRFEDLRATDELTCKIWQWGFGVQYGSPDSGPPSLALPPETEPSADSVLLMFDKQKTRALHYHETGILLPSVTRLEPPKSSLFYYTRGAVVVPHTSRSGLFNADGPCLISLEACRSTFSIVADPEFEAFFPLIGREDRQDRVIIDVGRCRPGIGEAFRRQAAKGMAEKGRKDKAMCGDFGAQYQLAIFGLLLSHPSGEDLVDAYTWLRVALRKADELSPEDQEYFTVFNVAVDIAARRLNADQIAEAERRAAAWQPDPNRCVGVPKRIGEDNAREAK